MKECCVNIIVKPTTTSQMTHQILQGSITGNISSYSTAIKCVRNLAKRKYLKVKCGEVDSIEQRDDSFETTDENILIIPRRPK